MFHPCNSVPDGDLSIEKTLKDMKWRHEDIDTFDIEEETVGSKVFNDETMPYRLYDASHESKNINGKIKKMVIESGFNTKLGGRNRLNLTLLVQSTMKEFKASDPSRTPGQWIDRVDSILLHCKDDHSQCDLLGRKGQI